MSLKRPSISPVLFMTVKGEPMTFFLRPGPIKQKLQPLIKAGGGKLCNVQQPGAILLIDPEEKSVPESAAHRYVSTKYISDCVEKEEQLEIEDYSINPKVFKKGSSKASSNSSSSEESPGRRLKGRLSFTAEEDAAILNYVSRFKTGRGGVRIWREMEQQHLTNHSWQAMKERYKRHLAKRQPQTAGIEMREDDTKSEQKTTKEVETDEECFTENSSDEEEVADPQTHSVDSDLTEIDVLPIPAALTAEPDDAATEEREDQKGENLPSEAVQHEPCHTSETEEQADVQPSTSKMTDPDSDGPSPQKRLKKSPLSATMSSTKKAPSQRNKQNTSPAKDEPQRRVTRRQLELEKSMSSTKTYASRLRSSSCNAEQSSLSLQQPQKKTKPATKSPSKTHKKEQPPPKRDRAKPMEPEVESPPEQNLHESEPEMTQTAPQNPVKKKVKRRMGILEMATKEFEDESECDEDEDSSLQTCPEVVTSLQEPLAKASDTPAADAAAESHPETGAGPPENVPKENVPKENVPLENVPKENVPLENVPETQDSSQNHVSRGAAADAPDPVAVTSEAHLFIFDSESQEEDFESVIKDSLAPQSSQRPAGDKDGVFSLTQVQLEEDKQQIRQLMRRTNQDLISVTKALLKTSGDFVAAANLLLEPDSISAPFWTHRDDELLSSHDPAVRQELQEKFGEENVARRIVFLELEI